MKIPRITVVGSSNTDLVAKAPRLPLPGETVIGSKFIIAPGGKGANQAVAIARLGGEVTFVAKLGMDDFGDQAINNFKKDNINVDFIFRTSNSSSGVALIFVDDSGENVIVAVQGANAELSPNDIEKARLAIELSDILVLQLEIPLETVIHTISIAKSKNIPVVLNPAPGKKLDPSTIKCINYLTPNETEAEILTGIKVIDDNTAKEAGLKLMEFGSENVIITMGRRGAMLITESECELVSGFKVEAVDTTAAGDAFNGGLAYAIASQKSIKDAVRFANAVAALSVTKMGAQPSMPFKSEVDEFILRGDE